MMKRNILFKTLVDILYIFQLIGVVGMVFIMPFAVTPITIMDVQVSEWTWYYWLVMVIGIIGAGIFLMALFHLRKVARQLLSNRYFDVTVAGHLKKCGNYFVASGVVGFTASLIMWVIKLTASKVSLYDSDFLRPLFLVMIGLFFIIQSEVILNAKSFKEDSELTI